MARRWQPHELTNTVGNATIGTRDALDRVTREEYELGEARTLVYDAVSNLTRRADRLARVIEYGYDAVARAAIWLKKTHYIFVGLLAEGEDKSLECRLLRIDESDHFTRLLRTCTTETGRRRSKRGSARWTASSPSAPPR